MVADLVDLKVEWTADGRVGQKEYSRVEKWAGQLVVVLDLNLAEYQVELSVASLVSNKAAAWVEEKDKQMDNEKEFGWAVMMESLLVGLLVGLMASISVVLQVDESAGQMAGQLDPYCIFKQRL